MSRLRIGTCSWKFPSWHGLVYSQPKNADYLGEYAERYDTVEIDQWFWSRFGVGEVSLPSARDVAGGAAIFSPAIARRMMHYFEQIGRQPVAYVFPELTRREHEVLALMAQQKSNQEIAETLSLTLKTVRNYTSNIFAKLQVADRAGAVLKARTADWLRDGGSGEFRSE